MKHNKDMIFQHKNELIKGWNQYMNKFFKTLN